jgi:gamma-glutamyltranspeptidase/glutathione hydrolase
LLIGVPPLAVFVAPVSGSDPPWIATGSRGMVATDSRYASEIGCDILKAGGNAIDAAVAVSFALAVTRPYSTGLGGGGFMVVRFSDGRVVVQDSRETAPAAATADMFVRAAESDPDAPDPSRFGHLAVAVPGLVAGRCQALAQWGTFPLGKLTLPAIHLAREGFLVDEDYVKTTKTVLKRYQYEPSLKKSCHYVYQTHLNGGKLRSVGDPLVQPKLAHLLEAVSENGPDFFYRGPVADSLTTEMKRNGGIITAEDLARYEVRMRDPIRSTYRRFELIAMPPPSSGGITLVEILNILEPLDLPSLFSRDPVLAAHYQIEAMKHAFADRARWLGDSDFVDVPVDLLGSKAYAKKLATRLSADRVAEVDRYGTDQLPDDTGTSHFSIVDRWGNVVVSTETINTSFGSLAAVDEWGLILNNEMDDFAADPGKPNAFGLIQSDRNGVEPGKRPLSSMSPTILLKDGKPCLMLGGSGGPRIITSVLNVLLGVTDFEMSLEQAMQHRRPHHQWKPDRVFFDQDPLTHLKNGLETRGHKLADKHRTGVIQAIVRTKDGWIGASDPRKGGRPAGY